MRKGGSGTTDMSEVSVTTVMSPSSHVKWFVSMTYAHDVVARSGFAVIGNNVWTLSVCR